MKQRIESVFNQKISIKTALMLYIFVIVIVLLSIISYISYTFFTSYLINQSRDNSSMLTHEVMANVDFYLNEVEETILDVSSNSNVNIGVKDQGKHNSEYYLSYIRELESYFNNITTFKPDIDEIIIVKSDGTSVESARKSIKLNYNFYDENWLPDLSKHTEKSIFVGPHMQNYYYDTQAAKMETVSAVAPIRDIFRKDNVIGTIIVNLNMSKISGIVNRLIISPNHHVYLLDDKQKLIYSNTPSEQPVLSSDMITRIGSDAPNGYYIQGSGAERKLFVFSRSSVNGWDLVWDVPLSDLSRKVNQFRYLMLILFIACIPVVWAIAYAISSRITSPVKQLMRTMIGFEKWIGVENVLLEPPVSSYHEIGVLFSRYHYMIQQINDLINQAYKLELAHKDSELKALQARINPHFLYNTLQTIKSLSILGKNDEVSKLVASLGRLFRYTIGNNNYMVTLQEELKHLQHYLDIQILWLRHEVKMTYDIDESLLACSIPRLSLQPIVENCFIHAFNQRSKTNQIEISVSLDNATVTITIRDNGVGMEAAELASLRRRLAELDTEDEGYHIALLNVHRRLVLKYGQGFGLQIESVEGEGVSVQMKLPYD